MSKEAPVVHGAIGREFKYLAYDRRVRVIERAEDRGSEARWVIATVEVPDPAKPANPNCKTKLGRKTTIMDCTLGRDYERVEAAADKPLTEADRVMLDAPLGSRW